VSWKVILAVNLIEGWNWFKLKVLPWVLKWQLHLQTSFMAEIETKTHSPKQNQANRMETLHR